MTLYEVMPSSRVGCRDYDRNGNQDPKSQAVDYQPEDDPAWKVNNSAKLNRESFKKCMKYDGEMLFIQMSTRCQEDDCIPIVPVDDA